MAWKRTHWPGLPEREYRIAQGQDAAAALVVDGELVAAVAEERIDRRKHSGAFPLGAIGACLEVFRPFAPAVSLGEVDRWFAVSPGTELPFMITTVDVRQPFRAQLPAITHVNGSARVQTVSPTDDPAFHALLLAVGRETGRQMLLNTSFNVKGQPIVNTPEEAIETFLGTGIEALFLENTLVRKRG